MWFESMPGSHLMESIAYKRVTFALYEFCTDTSKLCGRTHSRCYKSAVSMDSKFGVRKT